MVPRSIRKLLRETFPQLQRGELSVERFRDRLLALDRRIERKRRRRYQRQKRKQ